MGKTKQFIMTGQMVRDMSANSPSERLLHRAHCVALVFFGLSASEVARIFHDSPRAVSYWVSRFKKVGLKGLGEDTRPGRPSKLGELQKRKLESFVKEARGAAKQLNAEMLARYILDNYGVSLTIRQCSRILKRFAG